MMNTKPKCISQKSAALVRFRRDAKVQHNFGAEAYKTVTMYEGARIGNVQGHRDGVLVYEFEDGTVNLTLLEGPAGTERWEGIPLAALDIEWAAPQP